MTLSSSHLPRLFCLAALVCATTLSGCVALVGGAAATTAIVVTDRRTTGSQVEDKNINLKADLQLSKQLPGDNVRINLTVYDGRVLLTGDVPNEADKVKAESIVASIEKVRVVNNQLRVGAVTPLSVRTNDTWLGSKVRTALISTKDVPSATIVSTTERGVVYLMGKVTEAEANNAAQAVSQISGVNQVVKLFDIISREEALRLSTLSSSDSASGANARPASDTPVQSAPAGNGGIELKPIQ